MENTTGPADTYNSSLNNSEPAYPALAKAEFRYVTNSIIIPTSLFIVIILTIDMIVLNKCRRIPFQIKWLSNMFIISSLLSDSVLIIMCIMYLTMDPIYTNVILYVRVILCSCFSNMGWGGSVLLAIERIIALSLPLRYASIVKKGPLAMIIIVFCIITFVIPCAGSLWNLFTHCGLYLDRCYMFDVMKLSRHYFTITISIFLIFNLVAYVKISKILRRHLLIIQKTSTETIVTISKSGKATSDKEIRTQKKLMTLTQTISSIILIFVCLHFLPILHSIAFDILPGLRNKTWQTVFSCLSYLATFVNALLCSYMYIWRIQECKMMFLKTFMMWHKKYREEAEKLRLSVYDIVTNEKRSLSV